MPFQPPGAAPTPPTVRTPAGAVRVEGRPIGRTELDKPLKMPPSADFYLMHHPNGWNLEQLSDDSFELLPVLKDLVLLGGINRVEITPAGPDSGNARTKLRDQGWTVLEEQDEYRVAIDVAEGVAHRMRWDIIHRYPDGTYDETFDREGWLAFRRSLVERGIIAPPRPAVVRQLQRRLERRIGRRGAKLHIPSVAQAQERDETALQGLLEAAASPELRSDARRPYPVDDPGPAAPSEKSGNKPSRGIPGKAGG